MKQITNNIYQISLGFINTFLIEDNRFTLIDTGAPNSIDKIFSIIKKAGKDPNRIKQIVLTHCHPDHAGSVAEIQKRLNIPVYAHPLDADLIEQGIGMRQPMYLSDGIINKMVFNMVIKKMSHKIDPVTINERLKDGDVMPVAGGLQIIHTPGHCAGHIALLVKNEGVLIGADICANVVGLGMSTINEDPSLALNSILKAAAFDFNKVIFGHGSLLKTMANKKLKAKFSNADITGAKPVKFI